MTETQMRAVMQQIRDVQRTINDCTRAAFIADTHEGIALEQARLRLEEVHHELALHIVWGMDNGNNYRNEPT